MIIKKLVIENFRAFQGTHEILLEPTSGSAKPIILFGGLNGSGKTSILTAIRLALYGRLAFNECVTSQDYVEKLSSLIHRGDLLAQPENASIILNFTYNKAGEQSEFSVSRRWSKGQKDELTLHQDGVALSELNYEQCQGFLNELIPSGISELFFFDGEKISELAEDSTGKTLQSAVRRLLGLDLIEKLKTDLSIYLKRNAARGSESDYKKELLTLEEQADNFGKSAENFRYAADLAKMSIGLLDSEIKKQESILAAQGGAFAASKVQEQSKVDMLIRDKGQFERTIRSELEGAFPLNLAPKTMLRLLNHLETEAKIKQTSAFNNQFSHFLDHLESSNRLDSPELKTLTISILKNELISYLADYPLEDVKLDVSERELGVISNLTGPEAARAKRRFDEAREGLLNAELALEQAAANIDRAPDDEQLLSIVTAIRELDSRRQAALTEYTSLLVKAKVALGEQLNCSKKLQRLHVSRRSQYDVSSAVQNAESTLEMLDQYGKKLADARVHKLEANFEAAYQRLTRKKNVHVSARINAETFDVELLDEHGIAIDRASLSAGEKQIYALAVLDALAKTSGRQLPVIIDTPLGRLDSSHRDTLIDNYFPSASHQIIILSTDTEVHEKYTQSLSPSVSHSFRIEFDELSRSSRVVDGYFWKANKEEQFNAA
ncbi:DNA repair protein [Pseudomonas syringae pv. syringae PD2766]|uniref:DNA sulfur modification protein DndD n=1 Tax=Pseudomonas syringae TaxID=317 RepID=UPI0007360726|nr:DNA sulfur modification protein DndD [Pseudomonas syringae]KTB86199.1 DNA repair protein [Pseudomonas syringae pv. syringae PD2766]